MSWTSVSLLRTGNMINANKIRLVSKKGVPVRLTKIGSGSKFAYSMCITKSKDYYLDNNIKPISHFVFDVNNEQAIVRTEKKISNINRDVFLPVMNYFSVISKELKIYLSFKNIGRASWLICLEQISSFEFKQLSDLIKGYTYILGTEMMIKYHEKTTGKLISISFNSDRNSRSPKINIKSISPVKPKILNDISTLDQFIFETEGKILAGNKYIGSLHEVVQSEYSNPWVITTVPKPIEDKCAIFVEN